MVALTGAHPSPYDTEARTFRKHKVKHTKGKPSYGSGYDKHVYGPYEAHPVTLIKIIKCYQYRTLLCVYFLNQRDIINVKKAGKGLH